LTLERATRDRTLRIYKEREQDAEERHRASPDADGIAGHPALITMRDKNFPTFVDYVNRLPYLARLTPPDNPSYPPIGFRRARQIAKEQLCVWMNALWVAPVDDPVKVRLKHNLLRWVSDDGRVGLMLRPDHMGEAERSRLIQATGQLAFGFSVPFVYRTSQEIAVDPVEAERRSQPA